MLATSLTTQNSAAVAETYELQAITGSKSVRAVSGRDPGENRSLTISHQRVTRGKTSSDSILYANRHLIRVDSTEVDTLGQARTMSAQLVLEVPEGDAQFNATYVKDMFTHIYYMLSNTAWANLNRVLNNEP
jgi:hypothetical protein